MIFPLPLWMARRRGREDGRLDQPPADATAYQPLDAIRHKYEARILRIWNRWARRNRRLYERWCDAHGPYNRIRQGAIAAWDRITARERALGAGLVPLTPDSPQPEPQIETRPLTGPAPGLELDPPNQAGIEIMRRNRQYVSDELANTYQQGPRPVHPWQGLGALWVVGIAAFLTDLGINSEAFEAGATQVQAYVFGFALTLVMLIFAHFLGKALATPPKKGKSRRARRGWLAFLSLMPLLLIAFVVGPRTEYGERAGGIIGLSPLWGAIFLGVVNLAAYGIVAYVSYQYYDPDLVERRLLTKRQRRLRRQVARLDRRITRAQRRLEREIRADQRTSQREADEEARRRREEYDDEVQGRRRRQERELRQRARRDRRQHRADLRALRRSEDMYARIDRIRLRRVGLLDSVRDRIGELISRCRQELAEYAHNNLRARTDGANPPCLERRELARVRTAANPRLVPHYRVLMIWFEEPTDGIGAAPSSAWGTADPWQDFGRRPILSWNCESGRAVGEPESNDGLGADDPAPASPTGVTGPPEPPSREAEPDMPAPDERAPEPVGNPRSDRVDRPEEDYRQSFMPPPPPSRA